LIREFVSAPSERIGSGRQGDRPSHRP
jgi:hypothetical protein